MHRSAQVDWPADACHPARANGFYVTAAHFDSGDTHMILITGQDVRSIAAERFGQADRSAAVQQAERLHGALIHRHLSTNEIGPDGCDFYAQAPFQGGGAVPVDVYQAGAALADVFFQLIITCCRESQEPITATNFAECQRSEFVF